MQVQASRVSIAPSWEPVLKRVMERAAAGLGLKDDASSSIKPALQQLVLVEEGGQLAGSSIKCANRPPGMFATLLVQLPCSRGHEGGKLVAQHRGRSFEHAFDKVSYPI